jgi:fatty-acyl-CoA synthase
VRERAMRDDLPGVSRLTADTALRIGALAHPGRAALLMLDGPTLTYAALDERVNRLANALLGSGLIPGDRLAIWMANRFEYVETYLACLRVGVVIVQLNHRHTAVEATYPVDDSGAAGIVFDDTVADRVEAVEIAFRVAVCAGTDLVKGAQEYESFLAGGAASAPATVPADLAVIGYTSGTTGYPKGAELTHRSIDAIGATNMLACRYVLGSTQIFPFSLSFTAGIPAHVLPHLRVGGTTVLQSTWNTERLVDAIDRYRATFTLLPSPPLQEFCDVVEHRKTRLPSLVALLHSTARAPESHLERVVDVIGPRLVEGWGMTENSGGLVTATTTRDYQMSYPRIYSSAGRAVPGTVVEVVDEAGHLLPHDGRTVGALLVASSSLASGYWRKPEATERAFRHGWYSTGDIGAVDQEGYVYLYDRRTDLIVSGGMNVYPSEVERVLCELPGVAQCAVVAQDHDRWGQTPVAFVVRSSPTLDAPTLLELARTRLAGYKLPTSIRFVESLPTNAGGKVIKRDLRRRLDSGAPE